MFDDHSVTRALCQAGFVGKSSFDGSLDRLGRDLRMISRYVRLANL